MIDGQDIAVDYDWRLENDERSAFMYEPGEAGAIDLLRLYFQYDPAKPDALPPAATYKQTRNGLIGNLYSTKFSPYLAVGAISPRQISDACDRLQQALDDAIKNGLLQHHLVPAGREAGAYWVLILTTPSVTRLKRF